MALRLIAVIAFSLVINTLVNGKLSTWEDIGLTDQEYRDSLGREYIFFEITEPEQLAFTYKVRGQQFEDNPETHCLSGEPSLLHASLEQHVQRYQAGGHQSTLRLWFHTQC